MGHDVCFNAFVSLTSVSRKVILKLTKSINEGCKEPPCDGRRERHKRATPVLDHALAFFQFLYDNVAEPLAEGEAVHQETDSEHSAFMEEFAEWIETKPKTSFPELAETANDPVGCSMVDLLEPRYLNPTTPSELYDWYLFMHDDQLCASPTCFLKAWKQSRPHLKIRQSSQHARCATCAKYTQARNRATGKAERERIEKSRGEHVQGTLRDRSIANVLMHLSEDSTKQNTVIQAEKAVLYISLDGMDQACVHSLIESGKCFVC